MVQLFSLLRLGQYPRFISLTRASRPDLVELATRLDERLGDHASAVGLDEALREVDLALPAVAA